jgi:cyclophilin family peptidyl-prolyl cis-trans isomerase
MKYIRIENINLTSADRSGLLAMVNQQPNSASCQLIKELCRPKDHPVVTLSAQQFLDMLNRSDYCLTR